MSSIARTPLKLVGRTTCTTIAARTAQPVRALSSTSGSSSASHLFSEPSQPRFSTTNTRASAVHSLGREQAQPLSNNKGDAAGFSTVAGSETPSKGVWCVSGATGGTQRSFGNVPMGAFAVCEEFSGPWRRSL